MQEPSPTHDLGFTYSARKNADVEIFHTQRLGSTLRGNDAEDFKQEAQDKASHQRREPRGANNGS